MYKFFSKILTKRIATKLEDYQCQKKKISYSRYADHNEEFYIKTYRIQNTVILVHFDKISESFEYWVEQKNKSKLFDFSRKYIQDMEIKRSEYQYITKKYLNPI